MSITPDERKWIESQIQTQGLKGTAAKAFTSKMIGYFGRKQKRPRKPDFTEWNFEQAIPGIGEYLKTQK